MDEPFLAVKNSIPKPRAAPVTAQSHQSSGFGSSLVKALIGGAVKGTITGLTGQQYQSQSYQGSDGGSNYVDNSSANMAFQQSLQNDMWSSVDQGADFNIQ
jgi:hypothetical protein